MGAPPTHRKDTVSPPQLPAEVSRASSQDEGHKDPLTIFPSNNVEAQAGGAFVQDDFPGLPGRTHKGDIRVRSSKAGDRLFCAQALWHTGGAGVTRVQPGVTQPSVLWRLINQKRCDMGHSMDRDRASTVKSHTETLNCMMASDAMSQERGIKPLHSMASVPTTPCTPPMPQTLHSSTEVLNLSMMT